MQMKWMMTPKGLKAAAGCADPRELLGFVPSFILENDPRPVSEQIGERYCSGWSPITGFVFDPKAMALLYPGDPPCEAYAFGKLRDELVIFFDHEILAVVQPDGSFVAVRVD